MQERVYNGRLDPCGAVHITIGDGGNREGLARRYHSPLYIHASEIWSISCHKNSLLLIISGIVIRHQIGQSLGNQALGMVS
jgi:hypothetical protein